MKIIKYHWLNIKIGAEDIDNWYKLKRSGHNFKF